ncbi:uncharacterized protein RAG0_04824 [Rhynchosporium agropyri]|uniref:Uncharacterized protein n=1 Tax=Rhynchosporium agropyri TaxID=914238 RepID=A0A1E1KAC3_9HELO|nr:uncharacterized protein RAG0_04824 [Rhynchosporium agropyri]
MTGKFSEINAAQCKHYARFLRNLTLSEANGIFWILFAFVLLMMCISSLQHHKSIALTERDKSLPPRLVNSTRHKLKNRRARVRMLSIASLCLILSATAAVVECFALFNIEFCDGEDLMQLYWGFWSVLQVGSIIAILGVMVQFWIVLGDVETPSWAVALGTPVLVFAALGFVLRAIWKDTIGKVRGKKSVEKKEVLDVESGVGVDEELEEDGQEEKNRIDRSMSTAPTIVNDETRHGSTAGPLPGAYNGNTPVRPQPVPRGGSNLWTRDLHYLLSSVVHGEEGDNDKNNNDNNNSPREIHVHHHHHTRRDGRGRDVHMLGDLSP